MNIVALIGRMATDPELKYTTTGLAVANFRIAVDKYKPGADGEREADFFPVVAWKQAAEFAANYLTKGRLVAVDGRLQTRSWTAQDGTKRQVTEVVAEHLRSLDKPKEERAAEPAGGEECGGFDDPFADE